VTSFPNLSRKFFDQYDSADVKTSIKYVSGSVEAACALGLADAVVDLVETGTTMKVTSYELFSLAPFRYSVIDMDGRIILDRLQDWK
jgi:ATP phosphoribosyltransferase